MIDYKNLIGRGLKYAFGYKSRFGDWDSTIFKKEDLKKLRTYLDERAK